MAYQKKKIKKTVRAGIFHINATFNNTIITVTDQNGEVAAWESAGSIGYKGSRKSTPFAAQLAMERVAEKATKLGLKEAEVRVRGPGAGRESAIRALINSGVAVKVILDVTPLPHNGCRPRKKRRV
ncbi:MAG: 30S ribosomal protein S11 [Aestuariivirga sp.]